MSHCVACGQKIETVVSPYTLPSGRVVDAPFHNHHCSERFENMRRAIDRRSQETYPQRPTEGERLNAGFNMLALGGDW
jgi:hypothetical protein